MGRRGPAPTPTSLRLLRGNPGKRAINKREPKPAPLRPTCPRWLNVEAKREWRRVVPELERLGLLTRVDRAELAAYCQSWARWKEAEEFIEKHGPAIPIRDADGRVKYLQQIPQVSISQKERQAMRAFASEFGLSPSSRSRIQVPEQQADDIDALLG